MNKSKEICLPKHIGIIMDGNGRWAKSKGLPRSAGHTAGAQAFRTIAKYCNKIGIEYLTVYAFSTENWKRPPDEVKNIMDILRKYLKDASKFKSENIKVKFIGDLKKLPEDIQQLIKNAEDGSADATGLRLNIAINYGGRDEILSAVKSAAQKIESGKLCADALNEDVFTSFLYTSGMPDPDIIIRPSGEYRLSNFMIWQSAYSEFCFMNVMWPDFKPRHIDEVVKEYSKRDRRFGGV